MSKSVCIIFLVAHNTIGSGPILWHYWADH